MRRYFLGGASIEELDASVLPTTPKPTVPKTGTKPRVVTKPAPVAPIVSKTTGNKKKLLVVLGIGAAAVVAHRLLRAA